MRPCNVIEIVTPKKFILNGLWFGPKKPKQTIIFIHGLTASAFSMSHVVKALVNSQMAVITFNNRGFEQISEVKKIVGKKQKWTMAGAGHEKFTDCVDDIQGAINFVRKAGAKNIYLAGHSTGSQKICYWAGKGGRGAKGLVLFGPLSDYSILLSQDKRGRLRKAVAHAKRLVQNGKPHEFMPEGSGLWFPCDAQRFLSLSTPESAEEIFMYWDPSANPRTLKSVKTPLLVLLAERDEYADRLAKEIAAWFEKHLTKLRHQVLIVPKVKHSFKGGEKVVARAIRRFIER